MNDCERILQCASMVLNYPVINTDENSGILKVDEAIGLMVTIKPICLHPEDSQRLYTRQYFGYGKRKCRVCSRCQEVLEWLEYV